MFLDIENLTVEELVQKQIELRQRIASALSMGMSADVLGQLQSMMDQISIQIKVRSAYDELTSAKENSNSTDGGIDGVSLNIE
jgi:flagellar biosynthesis chaperone FliJ